MRLRDRLYRLQRTFGYAICTSPRTGSNLLCQWLSSTGELGRPLEYFNGPGRRKLGLPNFPDDPALQIDAVLTLGRTPNGVYGAKLFPNHAAMAASGGWPERLPNLRYIHLSRRDRLGQALSWARGIQTGQYRSTSPVEGVAAYDQGLIADLLARIEADEASWRGVFNASSEEPLRLVYEDMLAAPQATVDAVAGLLGHGGRPRIDLARVDLRLQRDALTESWRERYLSEARNTA